MEKAKSYEANLHTAHDDTAGSESGDTKTPNYNLLEKIKIVVTNVTLEPIMICYNFPSVMSGLATQNLSLEKACRVDLNYTSEVCDAIMARNSSGYEEHQEIAVQALVATAGAYKSTIQSLIPAMLLMFAGSWSDRHNKRKPCILLPIIGEMVLIMSLTLCTYFFYDVGIVFNVLSEGIPPAVTGGWFMMYMACFSYISSITTSETRTVRIGAVNMLLNVSFTVGLALSGILFVQIGYYGIFFISIILYAIGFLYGLFRLKECPSDEKQIKFREEYKNSNKNFFTDFFDFGQIKDTLQVALKKGARNRKKRVCTIMILVMVIIGPLHGEYVVQYLFVRHKFKWSEMDYSIYSTFNLVAHMTGTLFSLAFFSKYLKLHDSLLGMISCCSKVASSLVYAFAPTGTIFYLGAIAEMLNGTSFIAMRSLISKLVPQDELGKIYSLFGVSEALMPLVYGPMYTLIYKSTIDTSPGMFYLAGGGLTMPAVFIFYWLYTEHKKDLEDEEENKKVQEKLLAFEEQQAQIKQEELTKGD